MGFPTRWLVAGLVLAALVVSGVVWGLSSLLDKPPVKEEVIAELPRREPPLPPDWRRTASCDRCVNAGWGECIPPRINYRNLGHFECRGCGYCRDESRCCEKCTAEKKLAVALFVGPPAPFN